MSDLKNIKRFKLGIIFNFSSTWLGGIFYVINIVKTLDLLEDKEKPEIFLFYRADLLRFTDDIKYSYITLIEWPYPHLVKGYILSLLWHKNVFVEKIIQKYSLDAIFPLHDFPVRSRTNVKLLSWWADLQHKHYPEFFSKAQVLARNIRIRLILQNSDGLVVSSQDVLNDFLWFFNIRKGFRIHIFHFVSVLDDIKGLSIDDLRGKYRIPEKYFMISNQFHRHKNHKVLLKALVRLKDKESDFHLVMTGRFPDASSSSYMQELHSLIKDYNLQSRISLMGIIPRNEQLLLMKHSQAVLQPSLFEGWSTVIEDAISLQVPVIASSLPVNMEQLGPNGNYFEPHDDEKLAEILLNFPARNINNIFYPDYEVRIKNAARILLNIFKDQV